MKFPLITFLKIGRISNLPTVFSNVALAFFLSGNTSFISLSSFFLLSSFFYIGGIYFSDWRDSDFDLKHSKENHFSSFGISEKNLLSLSLLFLSLGFLIYLPFSTKIGIFFALLLLSSILAYGFWHKKKFGFLLLGFCRSFLYLWVFFSHQNSFSLENLFPAMTLFSYAALLTFYARDEHFFSQKKKWVQRGISGFFLHDILWLLFFAKISFLPLVLVLVLSRFFLQKHWRST